MTGSKKSLDFPISKHPTLSVLRQCKLAGLARSSYYYAPIFESEQNLLLRRLLDQHYTRWPFYGSRRLLTLIAELIRE